MRFAQPEMLWVLLAIPLIVLLGSINAARKRAALRRFAGGAEWQERFTGQVSAHRRVVKLILVQLALLLVILSAARPQWGKRVDEIQYAGVDVVILLDSSLSMVAEDIAPNRLDLARHEISTLIESLAGDRVALITFAGVPTLACPLTVDHGAVRLFLGAVEAEVVQIPGTALADAIKLGIAAFGSEQSEAVDRSRALILFTDGEDHEGGIEELFPALEDAGVIVHAIGVGSTRGVPIPLGDGAYKKDANGRIITTRLSEEPLQSLALETGGHYYAATSSEREVHELAKTISGMNAAEFGASLRTRYQERYQIPLAIALLALIVEALLGERRGAGAFR